MEGDPHNRNGPLYIQTEEAKTTPNQCVSVEGRYAAQCIAVVPSLSTDILMGCLAFGSAAQSSHSQQVCVARHHNCFLLLITSSVSAINILVAPSWILLLFFSALL